MTYSAIDFNSKGEISKISLVLTSKNMETANGSFNTINDNAISEIQLGKRGNDLFIKSEAFDNMGKGTYTYKVTSEFIEDDGKNEKIIVKSSNGSNVKVNTWIRKDDVKTIDVKREDGKEFISINGKKIAPNEIIEEKIEIENEDGTNFIFVETSTDKKDKDAEIEIIKEEDSKIVFNNSNNKKPLIIIDGKIADKNKMKDLDTNKIKSVSVFKGESAIKKYGEKGKDGVIIIATKK